MASREVRRLVGSRGEPWLGSWALRSIKLIGCFLSGTQDNDEAWGKQLFQCQIVQAKNLARFQFI